MRVLVFGLICGLIAGLAQAQRAAVQPQRVKPLPGESVLKQNAAVARSTVFAPVLGFLPDPNGAGLVPILGIASSPSPGETLPEPAGVTRIFLPPRQHYALVEKSIGGLAVWHLASRHIAEGKDLLDTISGAFTTPDMVVFSATGTSAVLYSEALGQLQVVTGLPGRARIGYTASIPSVTPLALAVSDDGALGVAADSAGQLRLFSADSATRLLPLSYAPLAFLFIPKTHDLVISDSEKKQLLLVRDLEVGSAPTVIANGIQANLLAGTSEGEIVLAADVTANRLWIINVKTVTVTPVSSNTQLQTLITLRDGHTFLISPAPLALLKLPGSSLMPSVTTGALHLTSIVTVH